MGKNYDCGKKKPSLIFPQFLQTLMTDNEALQKSHVWPKPQSPLAVKSDFAHPPYRLFCLHLHPR